MIEFLSFIFASDFSWIYHTLLAICILVYIFAYFSGPYKVFLRPAMILCIITLGFFEGSYYRAKEFHEKVSELEAKVKIAEEKSREVNTVIQTKYIEKIKVIKETKDANIQYIDRVVTKYDSLCTLSNAAIELHDSASQNKVAGSTGGTAEGTSDVKASTLIDTVTENYGTYYQIREQLIGWQNWYKEQKKIADEVK